MDTNAMDTKYKSSLSNNLLNKLPIINENNEENYEITKINIQQVQHYQNNQ